MAKQKDTHYLAFNSDFFKKHQKKLLWLLNTPIIKTIFRKLIFKSQDLWSKGRFIGDKIIEINNSYLTIDAGLQYFKESELLKTQWENPEETRKNRRLAKKMFVKILRGKKKDRQHLLPARTSVFFTDWNYSKQLYFAFKPIWWLMHYWDELFADRWLPRLAFGFSVLTVYPDAGSGATTVDGYVREWSDNVSWGTLVSGAGQYASVAEAIQWVVAFSSGPSIDWAKIIRLIATFNTSTLGAGATISATVLSLFGQNKTDANNASPNVDIYTATPASNNNLVAGDYAQIGTVSQTGSPITYAAFSTTAYNDFTFNATGRGNVSKTGISKFGARNANYDVANTAPSRGGNNTWSEFYCYSADYGSNQPKLVVTYTTSTAYYQTCSDTIVLSDSRSMLVSRALNEVLTLTDSIIKSTSRTLSDAIVLTDTLLKQISRNFSEAITLSDTFAFLKVIPRIFSETISLADTLGRKIFKVLAETLVLTDTITKSAGRVFSDAVALMDILSKTPAKILSETISLTDSILKSISKTFSETLVFTDTLLRITARTFNETLHLWDVIITTVPKIKNVLLKALSLSPKGSSRGITPRGDSKIDKAN